MSRLVGAQLNLPGRRKRALVAVEGFLAGVSAHVRRQLVLLGCRERTEVTLERVITCKTHGGMYIVADTGRN